MTSDFRDSSGRRQPRLRLLEHDGRVQSVAAWSVETGIKASTIYKRLNLGWDARDALSRSSEPDSLIGQRFGRLVVLNQHPGRSSGGTLLWKCRCDCGATTIADAALLRNGAKRSCGCLRRDSIRISHGETRERKLSPEYVSWQGMRQRCSDPGSTGFKNYGGKGVRVCERWVSFENFLADMGRKPGPDYSIERIDVDGNYEPSNCRWATRKEQQNNTSANTVLSFDGKTQTLTEWARELGRSATALRLRLRRGWSVADTLTVPLGQKRQPPSA